LNITLVGKELRGTPVEREGKEKVNRKRKLRIVSKPPRLHG
jgi:hypothetical protein